MYILISLQKLILNIKYPISNRLWATPCLLVCPSEIDEKFSNTFLLKGKIGLLPSKHYKKVKKFMNLENCVRILQGGFGKIAPKQG